MTHHSLHISILKSNCPLPPSAFFHQEEGHWCEGRKDMSSLILLAGDIDVALSTGKENRASLKGGYQFTTACTLCIVQSPLCCSSSVCVAFLHLLVKLGHWLISDDWFKKTLQESDANMLHESVPNYLMPRMIGGIWLCFVSFPVKCKGSRLNYVVELLLFTVSNKFLTAALLLHLPHHPLISS